MTVTGYEATKCICRANVRYHLEKRTIPLTAATHNELFVRRVGFENPKRKQLVDADFVA